MERSRLQGLLKLLVNLGGDVYKQNFEKQFLRRSDAFFLAEARRLLLDEDGGAEQVRL